MRVEQSLVRKSPPVSSPTSGQKDKPLIIIVDDDVSVREGLSELMFSVGFEAAAFPSTRELLESDAMARPGCLVLDVRMPGNSGLDLQNLLAESGETKPIIFLTGHGDIEMTVQAMKAGAVDFLTKPVRDQTLIDAVVVAIELDAFKREEARVVSRNVERLRTLTPREREVLREVARGQFNKQIAFSLGISEVTVKLHRGNVMRKMGAASIGELIRVWETLPMAMREVSQN